VLAWETVSCTDGGADCRFLFRGTAPLGGLKRRLSPVSCSGGQ